MRSLMFMTSSRSNETRRTALPASRWRSRFLWMFSIAPTSRPRVGCMARMTFSSESISRAMIAFCWLPPDMLRAVLFAPSLLRISNSSMSSSASSRRLWKRMKPWFWNSLRKYLRIARFSSSVLSRIRPYLWRSSGTWASPCTLRMEAWLTSSPLSRILPLFCFSRPTITRTSSLWPLPSIPATQRISPLWTENET